MAAHTDGMGQNASRENSAWLDLIRGLAATTVVLTHLRGFFFTKWSDLEPASQTALNFGLFLVTRLGPEAVIVFFVLSGYLVGGNALRKFFQDKFEARSYWAHRLSRLYTVLVPALVITALVDIARRHWLHRTDFQSDIDLRTLGVNLLFLNGVAGPSYGSNAPLWSLAYEFWFYVFGGCLLSALTVRFSKWQRAISALATIGSLWVMWPVMASYLPIWCLGAGLRVWPVKVNSLAGSLLALVFLGSLVVSTRFPGTATNYLIAGGISGVILWLGNREMRSAHFRKFSHFLASFSFSTYAIHYPLIGFLLNWLSPIRRNTASLIDWLEWGALALMVFSFCWLIYFCFERHTGRVRGWLAGKT